MTTIATNGVSVAADGRIVIGSKIETDSARKIFRIRDEIVGTRGDYDFGEKYLAWVRHKYDKKRKPKPPKDAGSDFFQALHVKKSGEVWLVGSDLLWLQCEPPVAIGTGAVAAMASMLTGDDPTTAIQIASRCDLWTGGNITEMWV